MKTQHTEGPWEIDDAMNELNDFYEGQDIIISKQGCPIAKVRGTDDMCCLEDDEEQQAEIEVQANAKLIAAAPELLIACEALIEANKRMAVWIVEHDKCMAYTGMDAHTIGIEAIKKAIE